jgi:hypothetical protein
VITAKTAIKPNKKKVQATPLSREGPLLGARAGHAFLPGTGSPQSKRIGPTRAVSACRASAAADARCPASTGLFETPLKFAKVSGSFMEASTASI